MKTNCKNCGLAFEIQDPPAGFEKLLSGLAQNLVCDKCEARHQDENEKKANEENRKIIIRRSKLAEEFLTWNPEKGNNKLLAWINANAGESLYIPGLYGTCKTRAVTLAAYQNRVIHPFMRFYRTSELIAEIMGFYSEGVREVNEFKEFVCSLDLLIMDDFGKEKVTDRAGEHLYDILDTFYGSRRKIWITTNIMQTERIIENLGADRGFAIVRRIKEKCKQWEG